MTHINPELLDRIASKLGVSRKSVYPRIARVASDTMLERDLAALRLAADLKINISRFSTPQQRERLRGISVAPSVPPVASRVNIENANQGRTKRNSAQTRSKGAISNVVFVVHGRNERLRKSVFDFLRALGLRPMEWAQAVASTKGANPVIGDILDSAMSRAQAVVVLFSPDDEARLKEEFCEPTERVSEGRLQGQARPNVLFEAGLALGRHPEKTLLVQVGRIKNFSDIAGKHMLRLSNDPGKRIDFANRLEKLKCKVDRTGSDWTTAGDFTA